MFSIRVVDHNTVSKVSKDFNTFSSLEHHCTSSSIVTTPSLFVSINCREKGVLLNCNFQVFACFFARYT